MAWMHSGYVTMPAGEKKLMKFRKHMQEVIDAMSDLQSASFDGANYSRNVGMLQSYLATLQEQLPMIEGEAMGRSHFIGVRLGGL